MELNLRAKYEMLITAKKGNKRVTMFTTGNLLAPPKDESAMEDKEITLVCNSERTKEEG